MQERRQWLKSGEGGGGGREMILMVDGAGVTHNMNDGSVTFRPACGHDNEPKHQGPDTETLKRSAVIIVIH